MTKVVSPKGPDWFIITCAVLTIAALGAHTVSVVVNIYDDPALFWPFSIIPAVMLAIIYLMCHVIAYEFSGKEE